MNSMVSTSSSLSSCPENNKHATKCKKVAEFVCNACLFCVCCPLAVFWCCFKAPCKIGWSTAKRARHGACCGSSKKVFAMYSSFSDIDSETQTGELNKASKELTSAKSRSKHRAESFPSCSS